MANEIHILFKENGTEMRKRYFRQKSETKDEFENRVIDDANGLDAEDNVEIVDIIKYA